MQAKLLIAVNVCNFSKAVPYLDREHSFSVPQNQSREHKNRPASESAEIAGREDCERSPTRSLFQVRRSIVVFP